MWLRQGNSEIRTDVNSGGHRNENSGITGPPGVNTVLGSANLTSWSPVDVVTNPLGSVFFHDATSSASSQKFYRVLLQPSP